MGTFRPGMPGIFLVLSASTSVASAANIPYDVAEWEEQFPWTSPGGVVIPRAGTYMVGARWARESVTGTKTTTIALRRNGLDEEGSMRYAPTTSAIRGVVGTPVRCDVDDVLEIQAVQSDGSAVTFTGGRNTLRVVRIGPERWTG